MAGFLALLMLRPWLVSRYDWGGLSTWSTVFVSVVLQALPFLALGVVLSAALSAFVPSRWLARAAPRHPAAAVTAGTLAGVALPGCECASVPLAGGLVRGGVSQAAALAFLLSAPAVNPVVIVATAVAFPGRPEMALARLVGGLLVAAITASLWVRFFPGSLLRLPAARPQENTRAGMFRTSVEHDLLHTGGFLVVGAALAAAFRVLVPASWIDAVARYPVLAVLVLALLAVVLAVCSEADAFVVAGLGAFGVTAQLAFLLVGPVVDVKLILMQVGTFGRRFAARFAPLSFFVAVAVAVPVAAVLL